MKELDIDRSFFYETGRPEIKDRTRRRLEEIRDAGMREVGSASFGVPGIMSGLYIEKVWSYSDDEFNGYMEWAKNLIKHANKQQIW